MFFSIQGKVRDVNDKKGSGLRVQRLNENKEAKVFGSWGAEKNGQSEFVWRKDGT